MAPIQSYRYVESATYLWPLHFELHFLWTESSFQLAIYIYIYIYIYVYIMSHLTILSHSVLEPAWQEKQLENTSNNTHLIMVYICIYSIMSNNADALRTATSLTRETINETHTHKAKAELLFETVSWCHGLINKSFHIHKPVPWPSGY